MILEETRAADHHDPIRVVWGPSGPGSLPQVYEMSKDYVSRFSS